MSICRIKKRWDRAACATHGLPPVDDEQCAIGAIEDRIGALEAAVLVIDRRLQQIEAALKGEPE